VWSATAADLAGPVIAVTMEPEGRLWRAIPRKGWLEVDSSTDHGATFTTAVRVNTTAQPIRATPQDRPGIAVDSDGNVFVTWAADAQQPWTRYIAWSDDGGQRFSQPLLVSNLADRNIQYQTVVQPRGRHTARVLWVDTRHHRHESRPVGTLLMADFNTDRPTTPAPVELHGSMCECCRLSAQPTADGGIALAGRMVFEGGARDIGLVSIAGDGRQLVRRLTDDEWVINACPEHGPALALGPGRRIHLAWFTQGQKRRGLFYAHSDDGGKSLSTPLPIGDPRRLPGYADVGVLGSTVAITWQQYDGTRTTVYAMLSRDQGNSWEAPREIATSTAAADHPFILSGDALYLSWYSADGGYQLLPLTGSASS